MYLFIFEDNSMAKYHNISDDDMESADSGYCSIIDVSEPNNPKMYFNGEWFEIETRGT